MDVRRATIAWSEVIADEWELDPADFEDRAFLRAQADLFNAALIELRDGRPPLWVFVAEMIRKMWTALRIYRAKRGRVDADETLDAFVAGLVAHWRVFVDVWRTA